MAMVGMKGSGRHRAVVSTVQKKGDHVSVVVTETWCTEDSGGHGEVVT
jgi:hypothetical protein